MTDEKTLVSLAQQGDTEAFENLINLSLPKLKGLIYKNYKLQASDIDEVIQIAMIKTWEKIGTFRSESAFSTWFYIIIRHEALDLIRKRNDIAAREIPAAAINEGVSGIDYEYLITRQTFEETAASILEKKETMEIYREMIQQVLDELSPTHSQIISLALKEGKSYKEIAAELNIPMGTVMSRLFFARKQAQKLIINYEQ